MAESEKGLVQVCQLGQEVLEAKYIHPGHLQKGTSVPAVRGVETNCLGRGDWGRSWTHLASHPEGGGYLCGTVGLCIF